MRRNDLAPNPAAVFLFFTRLSVLLGLTLGILAPAKAAFTLTRAVVTESDRYLYGVSNGDFNGDGYDDLLSLSSHSGSLAFPRRLDIHWGRGDGAFQRQPGIALGTSSQSPVVADFNRDGKDDVAFLDANDAHALVLDVMMGQGDGNFSSKWETLVNVGVGQMLTAGDLNHDGLLDLLVGGDTGVHAMWGNGDGTFLAAVPLASGSRVWAVGVGDFNGDGETDFIDSDETTNQQKFTFHVHLANNAGSFSSQNIMIKAPFWDSYFINSFVSLDFNKDGLTDLAVSTFPQQSIYLLSGHGDGTFSLAEQVDLQSAYVDDLVAGDFNRDGLPDLAGLNGDIMVFFGRDVVAPPVKSLFSRVVTQGRPGLSFQDHFIPIDWNGDGWPDIASVGNSTSEALIWHGNGDGRFDPAPVAYPLGSALNQPDVAAADLNGDGSDDLIVRHIISNIMGQLTGGILHVLLNPRNGQINSPTDYPLQGAPTRIATGDFTGDGKTDLLAINYTDDPQGEPGLALLVNNGDGTLQPPRYLPLERNATDLKVGDLNADGKLDLITSYRVEADFTTRYDTRIGLGNGDGTFRWVAEYPGGGAYFSDIADFNGDGKVDFLAQPANATVVLYLGKGDGTFQSRSVQGVASFDSLQVADFNNDGAIDYADQNSTAGGVISGYGDGFFATRVDPVFQLDRSLVADLNNDGKKDLVGQGMSTGITVSMNETPDLEMSSSTAWAKTGDRVTFTIHPARPVTAPPVLTVSGPCVEDQVIPAMPVEGTPLYSGVYTVPDGTQDCALSVSAQAVRSLDGATVSGSIPLTLDRVLPTTEALLSGQTTSTPGLYRTSVSVTLTGTDQDSGVEAVVFSLDNPACAPDALQNCTVDYGQTGSAQQKRTGVDVLTEGPHRIVYFSRDKAGNADAPKSLTFTINWSDPVAQPQTLSTPEDTPLPVTLTATDTYGDPLAYSIVTAPQRGTLSALDGNRVTYTPNPEYNGTDRFSFKANDGLRTSRTVAVMLTIQPVNDPPTAVDASLHVFRDTPAEVTLTATDLDSSALAYAVESPPEHGVLSGEAPELTYTPQTGYTGPDRFTFKVSDGSAESLAGSVNVEVVAPLFVISSASVAPGETAVLTLSATDGVSNLAGLSLTIRANGSQGAPPLKPAFEVTDPTHDWLMTLNPEDSGRAALAHFPGLAGPADLLKINFSIPNPFPGRAVYLIQADAATFTDDRANDRVATGFVRPGRLEVTSCGEVIKGDVNGDGNVSLGDVIMALRMAVGLRALSDDCQQQAADVDCNGRLTLGDVIAILQNYVLDKPFVACS
jgi:hypothetical protein